MTRFPGRPRTTAGVLSRFLPQRRRLTALCFMAVLLMLPALGGELARADSPAFGIASFTGSATIVPSGTWSSSANGNMVQARYFHTAVVLSDGKVLVAGGFNTYSYIPTATAELYDSKTGTWSATGSMVHSGAGRPSVLLPKGKVLVVGGGVESGRDGADYAELYDPASETWSPTGSLAISRSGHTATLLANGKVLVAGGMSNCCTQTNTAEIYDPASDTWSPTGSMAWGHASHTAVLLGNGKVLLAGGMIDSGASPRAELYDPASGTWSTTGSMVEPRFAHTAVVLGNGKVLVAAGTQGNSSVVIASAELYDPTTGTWSRTGSLATGRMYHTGVLLWNGKVLAAGGYIADCCYPRIATGSAELYDPATGIWMPSGSLTTARGAHTAVVLENQKVLAAGGYTQPRTSIYGSCWSSTELFYLPPSNTFTGTLALPAGWLTSTTAAVVLTGTASGAPVGAAALSNDNVTWSAWLTATNTQPLTTTWGVGWDGANKPVYLALQDTNTAWTTVVTGSVNVDRAAPWSSITALPGQVWPSATLTWSGYDATSGIAGYDVETRKSADGTWTRLLTATTATTTTFTGEPRATYYFRVRAIDNAGNVEDWPANYDATTTFDSAPPVSTMTVLPTYSPGVFTLVWQGSDAGSGIAGYDLQVRDGLTGTWTAVLTGTTALTTTYTGQHGHSYSFRVRATDFAGNVEAWPEVYDATTFVDAQPPTGTLTINGGALATTVPTVTLTLVGSDADSPVGAIRLSNDGLTWGEWLWYGTAAYNGRVSHVLTGTDGSKTVSVEFRDSAGNVSNPVTGTIRLDTAAGTSRLVSVNNGALWTNTTGVTLTVGAPAGTAEMQLSNDGGFAGASWQPFDSRPSWTIVPYGSYAIPRIVYVRVRDLAGNSTEAYSDDIIYDPVAPVGSITVTLLGGGQVAARATALRVSASASDPDNLSGVAGMRIGVANGFLGTAWEAYGTSKIFTGSGLTAASEIYGQFRDGAGNVSSVVCGRADGVACLGLPYRIGVPLVIVGTGGW